MDEFSEEIWVSGKIKITLSVLFPYTWEPSRIQREMRKTVINSVVCHVGPQVHCQERILETFCAKNGAFL